jgi:hypothetical protein
MDKTSDRQSTQAKGTQKDNVGYSADYYGICPDNSEFNNFSLVINYGSE